MVDLAGLGNNVLTFAILTISILIFGGIAIGAYYLYSKWKKYQQFTCVIWERDGFGQMTETYDQAGVFVDLKTKAKRLYLKKNKVSLNPDDIPYLPGKGKKVIYLLRTGLKNFYYIKPNIQTDDINFSVGEEDVNWAINDFERQKKMFDQNALLQYLPFIALAFVSIIIVVIFIYFFKDFAVLRDVAQGLKEAAQALAQAQTGTVVIPSSG